MKSTENKMAVIPKELIIDTAKKMLKQVPFDTIGKNAHTLFGMAKGVKDNHPTIQAQIEFLLKTPLAELDFEFDDENKSSFSLKNTTTGGEIKVLDKGSSSGDNFGERLRNFLLQAKNSNPNQTAYQAVLNAVRSPECSSSVKGFISAIATNNLEEQQLQLFSSVLINKLEQRIKNGELTSDSPENEIWDGIEVERIYDVTLALQQHIQAIEQKATELTKRGYANTAIEAKNLSTGLKEQMRTFASGTIKLAEFNKNCVELVTESEKSSLKDHRNIFGKILNGILTALKAITFSAVSVKPTDAIKKTQQIKDSLQKIKEPDDNNNPEDSKHPISRGN